MSSAVDACDLMERSEQQLDAIAIDSDKANACRLAREFGSEMRFLVTANDWLTYDGTHWRLGAIDARARAAKLGRLIHTEAAQVSARAAASPTESDRDRLADEAARLSKHARASESQRKMEAALWCAQQMLAIWPDQLDAHPWLLNVANGVVDLRDGTLQPHDPSLFLTQISPVPYDPDAKAPRWEQFVSECMLHRPALEQFLHRACGYTATGLTTEQVLFLLIGGGCNGKSLLLTVLAYVLGDYAHRTPHDLLMATDHGRHPTEIADLHRKRLALAQEVDEGRAWRTGLVKALTGEQTIRARRLYQNLEDVHLEAKLWVAANHRPAVNDQSEGWWRRVRVIPFDYRPAEPDPTLHAKLIEQAPGILAWVVRGAYAWAEKGLGASPEITEAVDEYRRGSDSLGAFVNDNCIIGEHLSAPAGEFITAYQEWCAARGLEFLQGSKLKTRLQELGHPASRRGPGVFYNGLSVGV